MQNAIWPALQPETVLEAAEVLELIKYDNERPDPIIRLGDPRHWPTLKLLDKAVRATGKRLVISVE